MIKAIVIELIEGCDLISHKFKSVEAAKEFIDETEWKCYLIIGDNLKSESYT